MKPHLVAQFSNFCGPPAQPCACVAAGVGLAQHNGIRTRALSATKDFQQDEVILASDSTRVIRAADLQGRQGAAAGAGAS